MPCLRPVFFAILTFVLASGFTPSSACASYAQFQETAFTVGDGNGVVILTVVRGDGLDDAISVDYATSNGTAVAGQDYVATTGTLTWASGDASSRTIAVPILQHDRSAGSETFNVQLSGANALGTVAAVVTIVNDITIPTTSIFHFKTFGAKPLDVTITNADGQFNASGYDDANAGVMTQGIQVTATDFAYDTAAFLGFNGTIDFPSPPGQTDLTVAPGNYVGHGATGLGISLPLTLDTTTTQWQVLQAIYDTKGHPLQFAANFTSLDASGNVDLQGEVRFHSDLPLRGSVGLASDTFQGNASDFGITVSVEHTGDTSEPVSAQYSTSDYSAVKGTDYVKTTGTLTWAAGDASTKTFTVPLLHHVAAGDRVFFVHLKGNSLDKVTDAGVTIADDTLTAANARPEPGGQVDPSYAVALTNSSQVYLPVIQPQQDGSTLIGGTFGEVQGQAQPGIARLDSRGIPDFSFHSPLSASAESQINAIVTQPDGKILVAGRLTLANGTTAGICRLNADGNLDTEFAQLPALAGATVYTMALQTDGRLVIAGTFSLPNGLARLNADGSAETSFKPPAVDYLLDYEFVVLQPDGRLIVGDEYNKIIRLKSDGGVDASFQPAFGAGFGFGGKNIVLQPDGKLILTPQTSQGQLVRLNHDGTLDTTFNVQPSTFAGAYGISSLALQPDGKLLLGLAIYSPGTAGIVRLNADGAVDTTFNLASMNLPASVGTLALAPDGRLLVSAGSVSTTGSGVVHEILTRLDAITPGVGTSVVTVGASVSTAIRSVPQDGQFTLTRTGDLSRKLVVSYTVKGDAVAGVDYLALSGTQKFKAGQNTAIIKIVPLAGAPGGEPRKLKLRLSQTDGYTLGNAATAKVTIIDAP